MARCVSGPGSDTRATGEEAASRSPSGAIESERPQSLLASSLTATFPTPVDTSSTSSTAIRTSDCTTSDCESGGKNTPVTLDPNRSECVALHDAVDQ